MRKYLLLFTVIALLLAFVTACGAGDDPCTSHVNENEDTLCDKCGEAMPECEECADANENGICDICGGTVETVPAIPPEVQALIDGLDFSKIYFRDKKVTYNGTEQKIFTTGTLPQGVSVAYEGNGKTDAGVYTVICKFYYTYSVGGTETKYYIEGKDMTAILTVNTASYDMSKVSFPDGSFVYDGKSHSLKIVGALPDGLTVSYEGGESTNAGEYTVTAVFTPDSNHTKPENMTAKLTILKADADMRGVGFANATFAADGQAHSIFVSGTLPEGVTVSYDGNGKSAAGVYTVTAKFTANANYNEIPDLTSTMTVKSGLPSGISLVGSSYVYDGTVKSLSLTGTLPTGYTVEYDGNKKTDAGTYTVTASVYNGSTLAFTMEAELIILKATVSPTAEDRTFSFDGEKKYVELSGSVPSGITVTAFGNGKISAGTHTVTFSFTPDNANNYYPIPDVTAKLTITPAEFTTDGLTFVAKGSGYAVSGYEGDDITVVIPESYNGLPVVSINTEAFLNNTKIECVIIPDTVTNIGNSAFRGCTALKEVSFGSGLVNIGTLAFDGAPITDAHLPDTLLAIGFGAFRATKLESITLPFIGGARDSSNRFLGYIFGAADYTANPTFVPNTLRYLTLSDGCTEIPAYSLFGLNTLKEVKLGTGVEEIGISAFSGCTGLRKIFIPKSVKTAPADAYYYNSPFFGCSDELVVYAESDKFPTYTLGNGNFNGTGFGKFWLNVSETEKAELVKNTTYELYLTK